LTINTFDVLILEATLRALAEQPDELPDSLQQSLGAIGQELIHLTDTLICPISRLKSPPS